MTVSNNNSSNKPPSTTVCGKLTKLLLCIAGTSCVYLLQHMPPQLGELSEEIQAAFDLPASLATTTASRRFDYDNITTTTGATNFNRNSRPFMMRRWDAWKRSDSDATTTIIANCRTFHVLFDQAPQQHGCFVDESTAIPFCKMEQVRIDVSKIDSPLGGEELSTVMGRTEEVEYPQYNQGSWIVAKPLEGVPSVFDRSTFHYIQDVLSAVTVVEDYDRLPCVDRWTGTTLFITRYEYVNLYHTMTDYFNTFFSYPDLADGENETSKNNVNIVFLDAHAKGNLDSVWQQVFAKTHFVKQLAPGGVCFDRAIFIPPGYVSPLYPKPLRFICPHPVMMEDFSNHFLRSYNLQNIPMQRGKIVIIDRVPYIAHPRSKPNRAERTLNNLKQLPARLKAHFANIESVSVVHFEELNFAEQLRVVREAHIVIGNHGAGLTHLVFMSDGSHLIEFDGRLPFFTTLSQWKPHVQHHVIRSVNGGHMSEVYIQRILIPTVEKCLQQ